MKIALLDRIVLSNILPKSDTTFEKLILSEEIREKIGVKGEEVEKYEIKTNEGGITWNEEGTKEKFEYDFSESEKNFVKEILKKLNDDNKMSVDLINIYKLFVS